MQLSSVAENPIDQTTKLIQQSQECLQSVRTMRYEKTQDVAKPPGSIQQQISDLVAKSTHLMRHNMQLRE